MRCNEDAEIFMIEMNSGVYLSANIECQTREAGMKESECERDVGLLLF
jgi:hypothetical protein